MKSNNFRNYLKSTIKELSAKSRDLALQARQTRGMEKHSLHEEKKSLGRSTRSRLVLYAFVRGVPYRKIERNSKTRPRMPEMSEIMRGQLSEWLKHEEVPIEELRAAE